ncbi:MAG TPA: ATP phosphoribosyltransferase regulatory subunit [bacterium]|nr:ATP phosphoribosyltransferase regulatory subunit [bacterium]
MLLERWQQIPAGTRDLLPAETGRVRAVTHGIVRQMMRWGYREVTTPTLEYLDVLVRGEGPEAGDRVFKLVDRRGEVLALRPEMTTPVARLVATRLREEPLPVRLAYAGQVFRGWETGSGRPREFPQVGCELIGSQTLEADAEIVALAVESLAAAGLEQFSVSLGHVGFLRGILAGLGLPEADEAHVRALLYQKDFVGLGALLERHHASPKSVDALLALPALRGPAATAEARRLAVTPEGQSVVRDLAELQEMLDAYGVGGAVTVDLSIIRDFDYYTGIVFEGHTAALGVPLLGGGRYDRLLERFGAPYPATGFAVRVERVLAAGGAGGDSGAPDVVVTFVAGSRDVALACARDLRAQNLVVTVEVLGRSWDDVARDAWARGAGRAVLVRHGTAVVREADGREREVALADLRTLRPVGGGAP